MLRRSSSRQTENLGRVRVLDLAPSSSLSPTPARAVIHFAGAAPAKRAAATALPDV